MTYATGRVYNDADSHVMATPHWLESYADQGTRTRLRPFQADVYRPEHLPRQSNPYDRTDLQEVEENLLIAKEWDAFGACDPGDRSKALDLFGFERQLVLSSFAIQQFYGRDVDLLYGGAGALNRAMGEFCSHDSRLYAVGFLPLVEPTLDGSLIEKSLAQGCRAFQVPKEPLGALSPTHPLFDPIWSRLQEARAPFILHVGPDGRYFNRTFRANGKDGAKPDVDGDGESILSKDFASLCHSAEVFLTALIFDGVLERFPSLRGGIIELGACWVVSWLHRIDMIQRLFRTTEPYLGDLSLTASDYVRRQLRFTPYSSEPLTWMMDEVGASLFMFSTDFPHPEGGRNPLKRFREHLDLRPPQDQDLFYADNFLATVGVVA